MSSDSNIVSAMGLCNSIRMEADGISRLDLPLDVFPQTVQKLILDLAAYENYNVEFTIAALLSAAATALGNAMQIAVKGCWTCSPSLYILLVGRAGLGKTPPLNFAYRPIREHDDTAAKKFKEEWDEWQRRMAEGKKKPDGGTDDPCRPRLVKTVITDFTTEAMLNVHKDNLRGIAVVVDEVLALFKSVNRYGNGSPLIEYLLSAYSGQPLDSVCKSERMPVHIQKPCINLAGSIQTLLLPDIFNKEYAANGLLDRFLFVYPKNRKISEWSDMEMVDNADMARCWKGIIDRKLSIPCMTGDGGTPIPETLKFSKEAGECFFGWYNGIIRETNAIEDDSMVESRKMKLNGNAARIALVLQALGWAAGESHKDYVGMESVQGAIRLVGYFEDCYHRMQEAMVADEAGDVKDAWLESLPDRFTTAEALAAARRLGMSRRTVFNVLERLAKNTNGRLRKTAHGRYEKVPSENRNALCTVALSDDGTEDLPNSQQITEVKENATEVQSATVQNADNVGPENLLNDDKP